MSMAFTNILSGSESHERWDVTADAVDAEASIKAHPLGVRPNGNALTTNENLRSFAGLFSRIPDELILTVLEWLDEEALLSLGSCCRALYAYSSCDQLWRDLGIAKSSKMQMTWRGSWRASLLGLPSGKLSAIDCRNLFSDALHRPFLCSQIPLAAYASRIPTSHQISRLEDLSPEDFAGSWSNKPFILTQPVKQWPAFKNWSGRELLEQFGATSFRAEAVDWPLKTYVDYMLDNHDESPLYLFDRSFVQKMGLHVGPGGSYWSPSCFGKDFFELFGEQRPDHRWLIVGPERSGSTFHKDPNATSAWNACVRGSKYWIMFPRSILPPGVHMSQDESEVTSPLSIAEWLLEFHEEARSTLGCKEGICREGELLHVPSGWWHLVVNLGNVIAVTQNFVPRSHLRAAVNFLKCRPDQVSGFANDIRNPYAVFMERLRIHYPDLVEDLQGIGSNKRKWEQVVQNDADKRTKTKNIFEFDFSSDVEDETLDTRI